MRYVRFCCISDLHGTLPDLSGEFFDYLLLAGDFSPLRIRNDNKWARWLDTKFRHWLERIPGQVICLPGNHDTIFERAIHLVPVDLPMIYLEDREVAASGFRIHGVPWSIPPRNNATRWAFQAPEMLLARHWEGIGLGKPEGVDILLSHGPPKGFGDWAPYGDGRIRLGSPSLLQWVSRNRPQAIVFGHCHSGYGQYKIGETLAINCSLANEDYEQVNQPIFFDLSVPKMSAVPSSELILEQGVGRA